jgi:hypothetical protein
MTQAFNLAQFANTLNTSGQTSLTSGVTGTLPITNGGTGNTTANAAINALLPTQAGNANRYLRTDGSNTSWVSPPVFGGSQVQTSASDITLTSVSNQLQVINITTADKRVILPNTTTISSLSGSVFYVVNMGKFSVDIATTNGWRIAQVKAGAGVNIGLSANSVADEGWVIDGRPIDFGIGPSYFASTSLTIENTVTNPANFFNNYVSVYALTSTSFIMMWIDNTGLDIYGVVGTISGGVITYGTVTLILATTAAIVQVSACSATNWLMLYTSTAGNAGYIAGTISGTTILVNASQPSTSSGGIQQDVIPLNSTQFVYTGRATATDGQFYFGVITHNGSSVATRAATSPYGAVGAWGNSPGKLAALCLVDTNKVGLVHINFAVTTVDIASFNARVVTISGTTPSFGTNLSLPAPYSTYLGSSPSNVVLNAKTISTGQFCVYATSSGTGSYGFAFNVSGTGVTLANATVVNAQNDVSYIYPFFNGNAIGTDSSNGKQNSSVSLINVLPDTGYADSSQIISTGTTPSNSSVTLLDGTTAIVAGFNNVQSGQPVYNYPTAAVIKQL